MFQLRRVINKTACEQCDNVAFTSGKLSSVHSSYYSNVPNEIVSCIVLSVSADIVLDNRITVSAEKFSINASLIYNILDENRLL